MKSESDPGKEIVDLVLDRLRKLADNCTGLQGTWSFSCSLDACICVRSHWKGSGRALRQREDLEARSFNARDSGTGATGSFCWALLGIVFSTSTSTASGGGTGHIASADEKEWLTL